MIEILFIFFMFIPTILMGAFKVWPLFWVFCIFDVIFGLVELYYVKTTKKSVSKHFWKFSEENKGKAIIILVSMFLMWVTLLLHLGWKLL